MLRSALLLQTLIVYITLSKVWAELERGSKGLLG